MANKLHDNTGKEYFKSQYTHSTNPFLVILAPRRKRFIHTPVIVHCPLDHNYN